MEGSFCTGLDGCGLAGVFRDNQCYDCFFSNLEERMAILDEKESFFFKNKMVPKQTRQRYYKTVCGIKVVRPTLKNIDRLTKLVNRAERIMRSHVTEESDSDSEWADE